MNNKLQELMEHITDNNPDVVFLTETWLTSEKNSITAEVKDYGYKLLHKIRKNREKDRGGGVGILLRSNIAGKQLLSKDYHSFEHNVVKMPLVNKRFMILITIYRLQYVPVSEFINEFGEILETFTVLQEDFIIAGDVNIHVETDECSQRKFMNLLDMYDLRQHVAGPTHIKGHTIDVVISPNRNSYVSDLDIRWIDLSHHFLIDFGVNVSASKVDNKSITYRAWKEIDNEVFSQEIREALSNMPETNDLAEKVAGYNRILQEKGEKFAPPKTKEIRINPRAPWFDSEYKVLRRERRKAEKRFRKTKSDIDKENYIKLRKDTMNMAKSKKSSLISQKIDQGSTRSLYQVVNNLTDSKKSSVLPEAKSEEELANSFLQYFNQKIEKIRAKFPSQAKLEKGRRTNPGIKQLSSFAPTTEDELRKIITEHGVKCSPEDPLPPEMLSTHMDTLLPFWVEIVNLSLEVGKMDGSKSAVIQPLIKELSSLTDTDDFKNYRPVSNLVFIGKLIERVVDIRLQEHLDMNNLNVKEEYGYKQSHSTEMLLVWVTNYLFEACDKNMPTVVLLLDLSAAFDTVDHEKLLNILEVELGITGIALQWFKEFLTNRTQRVKIGDSYSTVALLLYGVIQGSILGPRLFKIYIRSIYKRVKPTQFEIVGFADDHQLLKQFALSFKITALGDDIRNCLRVIADWMEEHFLCLNQTKTKILVVAPPSIQAEIVISGVILENSCIRFVDSAKNLGVVIDSVLNFEEQTDKLVKSCFMIIRKLSQVKFYLTQEQLQTMVSSLIFSSLDYCNALYYGLPVSTINKLQRVQNCAARLVWKRKIPYNSSLDEIYSKLHWLRIKFRIIYKILLIVYKCLHDEAPPDVAAMISYAQSKRTMKLQETRAWNSYGDRAFSHVAPKLWNLLPSSIQQEHDQIQFKKKVKSFLMTRGEEFVGWSKMR